MKFLSLFLVVALILLPFFVHAEFSANEKELLSIMQKDKRMERTDIDIIGIGFMDSSSLAIQLIDILHQGNYSFLEEILKKNDLKIDLRQSQKPTGNYDEGNYYASRLVLRKKVNSTPYTLDDSALYEAVYANKADVVQKILAKKEVDVNKFNPENANTPLSIATAYGYNEVIKLLLKHGADIEKKDKNDFHMTPLAHAVNSKKLPAVKLLVEAGANLNTISGHPTKRSPLGHAIWLDNFEIVNYLLEKGANPENYDKRGSSPLISAMWKNGGRNKPNQEAIISLLIEKSDVNHKTLPTIFIGSGGKEAPQTALIVALMNGQSDAIIDKLYTKGARIGTSINEQLAFLEAHEHKRKYQYIAGKKDAYIKGTHKLIASFKHSNNKDIQSRLVTVLGDEYEISIILGKELNKEDKTLFEKLAKESPVTGARYKMLTIIQQSSNKQQTKALIAWRKQYRPNIVNWCFKYLKEYADTLPSDGKQRVLDAIKVFEEKKC